MSSTFKNNFSWSNNRRDIEKNELPYPNGKFNESITQTQKDILWQVSDNNDRLDKIISNIERIKETVENMWWESMRETLIHDLNINTVNELRKYILAEGIDKQIIEKLINDIERNSKNIREVAEDYKMLYINWNINMRKSNLRKTIEETENITKFRDTEIKIIYNNVGENIDINFCKWASYAVWGNLLKNAIQAIKNQQKNIIKNKQDTNITITHIETEDKHIITIHNYWFIPTEVQQKDIFKRWISTKSSGIGLDSAKKFIEALKGNIAYTSTEKDWTTFTVSLPKYGKANTTRWI